MNKKTIRDYLPEITKYLLSKSAKEISQLVSENKKGTTYQLLEASGFFSDRENEYTTISAVSEPPSFKFESNWFSVGSISNENITPSIIMVNVEFPVMDIPIAADSFEPFYPVNLTVNEGVKVDATYNSEDVWKKKAA